MFLPNIKLRPLTNKVLGLLFRQTRGTSTRVLNTFYITRKLQRYDFSKIQAVAAANALNELWSHQLDKTSLTLISRSDLDYEKFIYQIANANLRTELLTLRQNETSALKSRNESLSRDIETLHHQLREELMVTKSEITIESTQHKDDIRNEKKSGDMRIRETDDKLSVELSELRADMETLKLQTTQYITAGIFATTGLFMTLSYLLKNVEEGGSEPAYTDPENSV